MAAEPDNAREQDAGVASGPVPISAAVCNYNGEQYLRGCLESLRAQTHPVAEIIVYDNASTDASVALVRREFADVRVVEMKQNAGPCPTRNRGLQEATHAWVLQVDSDIVLAKDCLEKLVREIAPQPGDTPASGKSAIVMPRAVFHDDPSRVHYDGGWFHYVGVMILPNFFQPRPQVAEQPHDVDACVAMALLLDRDAVLALGGYHPSFFILFEDHDLSYRLRLAGWRIRFVPDSIACHKQGTAGISFRQGSEYPARRAYLHSRNRWLVILRNYSWWTIFVGLPGLLLYEIVWLVFAAAKGNLVPYARGKWDLIQALPRVLGQRRDIQRQRRVGDGSLLRADCLTHAPMVKQGRLRKVLETGLQFGLRIWWQLVRRLVRR